MACLAGRTSSNQTEIWLQRFKKASGKPCITYDEMVEEALCLGWVDSVVKKWDTESNVQRITPRRKKKTFLSELNRQRIWKLQHLGKMTEAGIRPIADQIGDPGNRWKYPTRSFSNYKQMLRSGKISSNLITSTKG